MGEEKKQSLGKLHETECSYIKLIWNVCINKMICVSGTRRNSCNRKLGVPIFPDDASSAFCLLIKRIDRTS